MHTTDLRRRLGRLITTRIVISTLLLGSATFAQLTAPESFQVDPFFFLIGLTYALSIVYIAAMPLVGRYRWMVDIQIAGDTLIVSAFIFITGGIASYFSTLYVLPIVAASVIQFRRGGLLAAGLSAVLYSGLVLAQYFAASGLLPAAWMSGTASYVLPARSVAEYTVALNVFGFFAVAILSGSLAESARSAGVELERASTEIADLQAFNQHVIDSLPSGLVTLDPALAILTFNRAAELITDLPAESAIGRPVAEVLQLPNDLSGALRAGHISGRSRRADFTFQTPARGRIEIGLSAANLETPGGRAGFLITFQDVTDIKKLERDARMQQRLAAVGEMAAGIAHEIRNPLASMSGSIQILRQDLPLSSEQEQLMDIVLRESERLNTTIRSFLAYARPQKFAIARFDLLRAVQDTALLLRNSADVGPAHVIDVEAPAGELEYEADEGQIKQVLWNLATNGLRAMPSGGRLTLRAAADSSSDGVIIAVSDQGMGIPAEELDGLFQPFNGRFAKGAGLGLAIVHRIVSDYNGEIQVSSEPGQGTTVSIRLPARTAVTT